MKDKGGRELDITRKRGREAMMDKGGRELDITRGEEN